jgi:hypothetical protein
MVFAASPNPVPVIVNADNGAAFEVFKDVIRRAADLLFAGLLPLQNRSASNPNVNNFLIRRRHFHLASFCTPCNSVAYSSRAKPEQRQLYTRPNAT